LPETITIIGGGLTGLSLAIALSKQGIPVILHEAGSYPRHRVCGEFISGISPSTLETLGISETLSDAQSHSSITWFSGDKETRKHVLSEPALGLSRHLLDDRLQSIACDLGVKIHTKSRIKPQPGKPGTIWSAGRKPTTGKWIGLKAHVRGITNSSDLEMHTGKSGYLGITPVENGWFNVCGLLKIDRSITARHQDLLPAYLRKNGNLRLAESLENAEWKPDSFTAVAGFELGLQTPDPGILALGDSHSIIPPFTGNGMTMAFQSAETALPHILSYANGELPWYTACERIKKDLHIRFRKRLTSASIIHPLLFLPAASPLVRIAPLNPILNLVR
jgi:flavin-dependent dehydrogenase|tara:strand:- start:42672 stop:43673 length:1002 start_codon:yes stop_codon:yes gene_type:complete